MQWPMWCGIAHFWACRNSFTFQVASMRDEFHKLTSGQYCGYTHPQATLLHDIMPMSSGNASLSCRTWLWTSCWINGSFSANLRLVHRWHPWVANASFADNDPMSTFERLYLGFGTLVLFGGTVARNVVRGERFQGAFIGRSRFRYTSHQSPGSRRREARHWFGFYAANKI